MGNYKLIYIETTFDDKKGYQIFSNPSALPYLDIKHFQYQTPHWIIDLKPNGEKTILLDVTYKSQIVSNPPINMEMAHVVTISKFEIIDVSGYNDEIPFDKKFDNLILDALKKSQIENDKNYI